MARSDNLTYAVKAIPAVRAEKSSGGGGVTGVFAPDVKVPADPVRDHEQVPDQALVPGGNISPERDSRIAVIRGRGHEQRYVWGPGKGVVGDELGEAGPGYEVEAVIGGEDLGGRGYLHQPGRKNQPVREPIDAPGVDDVGPLLEPEPE